MRRWNIGLGLVHAVQAVAILALATAFALPVTATFMEAARYFGWRADHPVRRLRGVGRRPLPPAVGRLPLARGAAQFFGRYTSGLVAEHNYFRWAEYSLSSSVMIVLIAMLTGISDVAALIGIFAANVAMIFFGAVPTIRATGRLAVAVLARVRRGHRTVARRGRLPLVAR